MKTKTLKKAVFCIILILAAGFFTACSNALTDPAHAGALSAQRSINTRALSEMSETECVEFIIQNGVIIPQAYAGLPNLGAFIKTIINEVEANPNFPITAGSKVLYGFVEDAGP